MNSSCNNANIFSSVKMLPSITNFTRHSTYSLRLRHHQSHKSTVLRYRRENSEAESVGASYYELLEIEHDSFDPNKLKANYRRLQKLYHPDVFKDGGVRSRELNDAYTTLLDDTKRREYDRGFGKLGRPAPSMGKEGLVGPMITGEVIFQEVLACANEDEQESLCSISWDDDEEADAVGLEGEAVNYVRQWASTLAYSAETPLPCPLQCDPVSGGVRLAMISTDGGRIVSLGELLFTVSMPPPSEEQQTDDIGLHVQVRRQVSGESEAGEPLPGESRILKSFNTAMRRWRGQDKPRSLNMTGFLAYITSGAVGMIPWGQDDARAYDAYYLRPTNSAKN